MAVDSHIQIPKCILKHFSDNSHRVFYLDLETEHIGLTSAKKLGTEFGYYSDAQEKFLSKEIENPLNLLAGKVRRWHNQNEETLELPVSEETVLKRYIASAMSRSSLALESMEKSRGIYSRLFLSNQQIHDFIATFGIEKDNSIYQAIKDYYLVVLVNKTSINWVVPRNCFYTVESKGCDCIVAPISPQCALCLFPPKYAEKIANSISYRFGVVDNPEQIEKMNVQALIYEYIFNRTFVASASKKELEYLKAKLIEMREILNCHREDVRRIKNKETKAGVEGEYN